MTLGFSGLIRGLCRQAGADIPHVATKVISSVVREDYVVRHCVPKLTGEEDPQPHAHDPPISMECELALGMKESASATIF
ncbi:hypothetical protein RYX36_024209 [Vicia faba]